MTSAPASLENDAVEAAERASMAAELRRLQEAKRSMKKPLGQLVSRKEWLRLYWGRFGTKALRGEFP